MASKTLHTNQITFMDLTDDRKLDVYITSNLPITQIKNTNSNTYTPDWSTTNLILSADIYLDSVDVTNNENTKIVWYEQIGTGAKTQVGTSTSITINTNKMASNPMVTYSCESTYQNITAHSQLTFTRVDTGLNGNDGSSAPAVQAQYSVDGQTGWTPTLNPTTHKYIRHSYDGGLKWTSAIKIAGEDGTSVTVIGAAYTPDSLISGSIVRLYSDSNYSSAINTSNLSTGDSYLVNGYLCVYNKDNNNFICTGTIQGPKGDQGASSYTYIRYATNANGSDMSTSHVGKTYIGVCVSSVSPAPTTASSYTWSKFVGDSAKSIVLSGDSQVFKMSTSNVATPATIKVTAQAFNTSITTWTYSTNGGQTFVSTVPTGVIRNGNIVTITGSTLTTNSVVVKASDGSVEDVFTVYKAFDGANGNPGAPGTPASMAFLTNENVTLGANASGQILATSFSTNVVAYSGTTKTTPTIGTIANLPTGMTVAVGATVNKEVPIVFTIENNATLGSVLSNNGSITIPVTSPVNTNLILTWSKVNSGAKGDKGDKGSDAYTVILTNESHVFAGDVSNAVAGSATTQVLAYNGASAQTVTITSVNGKTAAIIDTDTGIAGLKFKCSALSGTSPTITFTCTTAFVNPSGAIPIVLSVGGVSITKMFTYSIAFKGATGGTGAQGPQGAAATSYWLVSSASAVQKTSTGTITVTPSTLTFTGKSKTGTNAPVDYSCRWVIDSSTDGTTYTNLYTSTSNEASKSIAVATTYKTIRARMYMAGGTTALLDEQIIPIVSDGAKGDKGVDAVTFQIYAPNGYLLTKELESLTLQTFAYEGSTSITSGATYQWSQFIDGAWTTISGATSATYTITQADVLKSKSYRCTMTYKSQNYTSTTTVQDKTDLYNSIMCISSNATNNDCYWVLYTLVYSDTEEVDPLLGPISVTTPNSPVSGDYWYAVDSDNATVTLKKYNGTSWVNSTDKQSLSYYWDLINDGSTNVPLGESSKVKVVSCRDFTATATLVCEVSNVEDGLLTQSSLSITDASDPIVSATEPTTTVDGQIWIKPNDNGTYLMFVWDASLNNWISSDMDTRNKVYTSRPSSYNAGDLWITASDTDHGTYLHGTLLQAQKSNTSYSASDWSPTLRYDQDIDAMKETLNNLSQYVTITSAGLRIGARGTSGELSPFTSLFTSTELSFYQNSEKLLTLANNQLTAPRIVVEDELEVQGSISLGDLKIIIESNGSFSFAVQK